nr:MAG TPA: Putative oxidoreductase [Caudoviricetes sp.]
MDAYLMLSFDTFEAKAAFCQRFGYDPYDKFVKGEVFSEQVERIV